VSIHYTYQTYNSKLHTTVTQTATTYKTVVTHVSHSGVTVTISPVTINTYVSPYYPSYYYPYVQWNSFISYYQPYYPPSPVYYQVPTVPTVKPPPVQRKKCKNHVLEPKFMP